MEPAFPSHGSMGEVVQEGMSLRDYFAAKALSLGGEFFHILGNGCDTAETVSIAAYQIADAMLEARKKVVE